MIDNKKELLCNNEQLFFYSEKYWENLFVRIKVL